jgi:hypothetical protein
MIPRTYWGTKGIGKTFSNTATSLIATEGRAYCLSLIEKIRYFSFIELSAAALSELSGLSVRLSAPSGGKFLLTFFAIGNYNLQSIVLSSEKPQHSLYT